MFAPLLFEFVVAGILIYLQHYYGEAVKAEALRKQIVFHTNQFWFYNMNLSTSSLTYTFRQDYTPYWELQDKIVEEYKILRALTQQDLEQTASLEKIMDWHFRSRALCQQLKPVATSSGGRLGQILALKSTILACKRLIEVDIEAGNLIRAFREYELVRSAEAAEKVRLIAWLIQMVIAATIAGSIILAYILFGYFMTGIHKGVNTLTTNIQRFRSGQPLTPAMPGADEIALLDRQFHDMAVEVEAAQKMKQAFLTTASREIGAPIRSARAFLTQLSQGSLGALSDDAAKLTQITGNTLERLIGLLNDWLALEAPGKVSVEIAPRMCRLSDVIATSIDNVSTFAAERGIHLEANQTGVTAYADADRIVQVLVNLLSNAVKFSPSGSSVTVSASQMDDQVEVRVTDTGRGIPSRLLPNIFRRFEQVAASDATEKGGSGLGLAICKDIVELHSGTVGVESEEGKGSTFWFRLPARGPLEG